ncbi:hypothetical protein, partial [Burkholderia sp. Bp9090]|uniref:hypothetical protein n=1 Tax=Burkholderia sp. Bp9090 TaxID=2184567 RepID=UPI001C8A9FFB
MEASLASVRAFRLNRAVNAVDQICTTSRPKPVTSSVTAKACAPDPWIRGATDQVEVERTFPRIVHVEAVRPRGVAQDL